MAWNGEDFQSRRPELLARVRARGEQLRQRRRLAWGLALPCLLLVVAIPAALALNGGDRDRTTVAAAGPGTTALTTTTVAPSTFVPTTTSETSLAPPPTTVVPRTTTPTSAPRSAPGPDDSTTTSSVPSTTIPATTTTTVADGRPPGPPCEASFFEANATVDKPSYRPGETVTMNATYRNTSGQTCYWTSQTTGHDVFDATGAKVTFGPVAIADAFQWMPFAPGETRTAQPTWDQKVCGDNGCTTQAPPGTYTIVHRNDPFGTSRATFQLLAG